MRCVDKFNLNYKYKKQTKLYDGSELISKFINKVIVFFFWLVIFSKLKT